MISGVLVEENGISDSNQTCHTKSTCSSMKKFKIAEKSEFFRNSFRKKSGF